MGDDETPLVATDYKVWALNDRLIQVGGKHDWRMGVRKGPPASGEGTNYAQLAQCAPPAFRKTSARELLPLSWTPGQLGFPPIMSTDAS